MTNNMYLAISIITMALLGLASVITIMVAHHPYPVLCPRGPNGKIKQINWKWAVFNSLFLTTIMVLIGACWPISWPAFITIMFWPKKNK